MRGEDPFPTAVADTTVIPAERLMGYSIAETAGVVAAVRLRDTNVTGQILASVKLAAADSKALWLGPEGVVAPGEKIYIQLVAGTVEGSVYAA